MPGAWHVLRSYEGGDAGSEELEQGGSPQWGGVQGVTGARTCREPLLAQCPLGPCL